MASWLPTGLEEWGSAMLPLDERITIELGRACSFKVYIRSESLHISDVSG